jgi:heme A synthase
MKGYPRRFRTLLLSTMTALFLSGTLLLPTTLAMRLDWDVIWRLGANTRIGMAALHVAFAFVALGMFGSLWAIHMRAGWRQRRNYRNGFLLIGLLIILIVTGLGIFYLADEAVMLYTALTHIAVGLLLPIFFIYHMIMGRRIARQYSAQRSHKHDIGHRRNYRHSTKI